MNCNDTRPGQDVTLEKFGLPQNLKVETHLIEINVCFCQRNGEKHLLHHHFAGWWLTYPSEKSWS